MCLTKNKSFFSFYLANIGDGDKMGGGCY